MAYDLNDIFTSPQGRKSTPWFEGLLLSPMWLYGTPDDLRRAGISE